MEMISDVLGTKPYNLSLILLIPPSSVISKKRQCWIHDGVRKVCSRFQCNNALKPSIQSELGRNLNRRRRHAATPHTAKRLAVHALFPFIVVNNTRVYGMHVYLTFYKPLTTTHLAGIANDRYLKLELRQLQLQLWWLQSVHQHHSCKTRFYPDLNEMLALRTCFIPSSSAQLPEISV